MIFSINKFRFIIALLLNLVIPIVGNAQSAPATAATPVSPPPYNISGRGIHAIYSGDTNSFEKNHFNGIVKASLALPYVSGFSLYVPWKLIEPQDGVYDWRWIDTVLADGAAAGKPVSIALEVAHYAPDWIMDNAPTYSFKLPTGQEEQSIVPWDPCYVQKLQEAVAALGNRYNGNPAILFVAISGPASFYGVETNWSMIPGSMSQLDMAKLNFSLDKYVSGWEGMIDAYFKAFPNTPLALALHNKITFPDATEDPELIFKRTAEADRAAHMIRDYALAEERRSKPGEKMWMEELGLMKGGNKNYFTEPYAGPASVTPYAALLTEVHNQAQKVYQIGVMRNGIGTGPPYSVDDVDETMKIGISFDADVIEVQAADLISLDYLSPWSEYAQPINLANYILQHKEN